MHLGRLGYLRCSCSIALEIIPGLPQSVRETLSNVTYSSACRLVMGLDHPPLPPAGTA